MSTTDPAPTAKPGPRNSSLGPRPFLRWAGSKRRLLKDILAFIPGSYGAYYEPFLGGGSLFFALQPSRAHIADTNSDLISTYRAIRDGYKAVATEYERYDVLDSDAYYHIRSSPPPANRFARAARFIYFNRAAWNGLYRVNSSGQFNVPYGMPKTASPLDIRNLRACSQLLRANQGTVSDCGFEHSMKVPRDGDLVYLDPPYVTTHNSNGFIDYNKKLFSWNDQVSLANRANDLRQAGVYVLVSNANHPPLLQLYPAFQVEILGRQSTLANDVSARRKTTEVLLIGRPDGK